MNGSYSDFGKNDFNNALRETIKKLLIDYTLVPVSAPHAFLLGGQSGAGKTTLYRIIKSMFNGNALVINGDEYGRSHPNFKLIQSRYGKDTPVHTAKWAGQMTEALIDAFSQQHYNLIIEGTLRTSTVPLNTATLLRSRGYSVSLAIMAVKPEISLVSCQIRYEMMRLAGTTPRATDPEYHNKIVNEIVSNLETLEDSQLFDKILIYDRAETLLYHPLSAHAKAATNLTAKETLHHAIFGPWTEEEKLHYQHLSQQLENLQQQ